MFASAMTEGERQRQLIADFCVSLAIRPDGGAVRAVLARGFIAHRRELWPLDAPANVTDEWITGHLDEILAVVERLYNEATALPVAQDFLDRMAWLPRLIEEINAAPRQ